jgi:hypothetical protein
LILGDVRAATAQAGTEAITLDGLLRRAARQQPHALALADPPNRSSFTDGAPRRLTNAEADRIVSAIACRLQKLGVQPDTVVAIQLPNIVEAVLTILGVIRAGLIAAPLPLLWRRADAAAALSRLAAKVIVTTSHVGETDHCALAMQMAADTFPIRYVCSFGQNLADGIIPLDDLLNEAAPEMPAELEREGSPASHVALVTWDITPEGPIAVARSHAELVSGGLATLLEGGLAQDARLLGCCALSSFAGLAVTMVPWLLSGGTLSLHHGFDADSFAAQCRDDRCDTVVLPGPLVQRLDEAGLLAHDELRNVLAFWRAPERLLNSASWDHRHIQLVDILVFGEIAVIGSRRDVVGRPDPPAAGAVMAPRGAANAVLVAEAARTLGGTVALRGPMVPRHAFPPGAERLPAPHLKADGEGFVDTGYACRLDRMTDTFMVSAPPPGTVSVGGYRFVLNQLEELVQRANRGAFVTALPDALAGHRLAGISGDTGDIRSALTALGVNPLLAAAFGEPCPSGGVTDTLR